MTHANPGEPLNPTQGTSAEGLKVSGFLISSHVMHVGSGQYSMCTPVLLPVPLQHAQYKSTDVPAQSLRADYQS